MAIIVAALLSSIATFLILNGLTPIVPTDNVVLGALGLTAALVLAIIGIVGFQIIKLLKARKRQTAGAGLHFQLAGIFSLVALFPAVLLAIFATVSIEHTFDALFSTRVKSIVSNSVDVAQILSGRERRRSSAPTCWALRASLRKHYLFPRRQGRLSTGCFRAVVSMRNLPSAFLIDSHGNLAGIGGGRRLGLPAFRRPRTSHAPPTAGSCL